MVNVRCQTYRLLEVSDWRPLIGANRSKGAWESRGGGDLWHAEVWSLRNVLLSEERLGVPSKSIVRLRKPVGHVEVGLLLAAGIGHGALGDVKHGLPLRPHLVLGATVSGGTRWARALVSGLPVKPDWSRWTSGILKANSGRLVARALEPHWSGLVVWSLVPHGPVREPHGCLKPPGPLLHVRIVKPRRALKPVKLHWTRPGALKPVVTHGPLKPPEALLGVRPVKSHWTVRHGAVVSARPFMLRWSFETRAVVGVVSTVAVEPRVSSPRSVVPL